MNADLWRRARDVFDAAVEKPPAERLTFARHAAGDDAELWREVESLLRSYEASNDLMERSPAPLIPLAGAPSPDEGQRFGPWRLLREVGEGGSGIVYAAARDDASYQKLVALKLLRPDRDSREMVRRFRMERQVLASLDHPNIGRMLDAGTSENGRPYLVMEFIEGVPIDQWCESRDLSTAARIRLFLLVCDAVGHAHRNLIVHCDLKPPNILVTSEGVPKLLDFGIAKLLRPELAPEGMITRSVFGRMLTPEYASPEQIRGEPVRTAVDIYSLGVLLYRLLTSHHPYSFPSESMVDIERTICQVEPKRPSQYVPRLRGDLDAILLKALRKEPHLRYESVEQFAADLRSYLEGRPVAAHRSTFQYRAGKFIRRNWGVVAATTAAVLLLTGSAAISIYYARAANARFQQARELTRFMIFRFDDAIRQGQTNARRVLVSEGLGYIQRLSLEAGSDPSLARELADSYVKMGDIQGNPYLSNLGDAQGARRSYEAALAQAERLQDPLLMAKARIKLGDLDSISGDRARGLRYYEEALRTLPDSAPPGLLRWRAEATYKRGIIYSHQGNAKRALASYEEAAGLARRLTEQDRNDGEIRRLYASCLQGAGEVLAESGDPIGGIARLSAAADTLERMASANPESEELSRQWFGASMMLADVLQKSGRHAEAAQSFRQMLRTAEGRLERDPSNARFQRDRWVSMARLAQVLETMPAAQGEARSLTASVLRHLEPLVAQPQASAYDLHYAAWLMVKTPFAELRNPAAAIPLIRRAIEQTNSTQPALLDLLACAQAGTGDFAAALRTEREALALLPPRESGAAATGLRKELEANLAEFEQRAATQRR